MLRDELTRPPAAAFFDLRLELAPLSEEQQREFLRRRLGGELESDVMNFVGRSDGLPRSLLELVRAAVLSNTPVDELLALREKRRERLAELPSTASAIVAYLEDHGPVSGSDPRPARRPGCF